MCLFAPKRKTLVKVSSVILAQVYNKVNRIFSNRHTFSIHLFALNTVYHNVADLFFDAHRRPIGFYLHKILFVAKIDKKHKTDNKKNALR